jgi:hypothetical protein
MKPQSGTPSETGLVRRGNSRLWRTARSRGLVVLSLAALLIIARVGTAEPVRYDASAAAPNAVAPTGSGFRLGTGGRPFGWATAIADLDRDGKPDFAIADRIERSGRRDEYELDIELSAVPPQRFPLASSDAVAVDVIDIDQDNDLDIVVTSSLTGEIVGEWLNDGTGRFSPALGPLPPYLPRRSNLAPNAASIGADPIARSPQIQVGAAIGRLTGVEPPRRRAHILASDDAAARLPLPQSFQSRAPPTSF